MELGYSAGAKLFNGFGELLVSKALRPPLLILFESLSSEIAPKTFEVDIMCCHQPRKPRSRRVYSAYGV